MHQLLSCGRSGMYTISAAHSHAAWEIGWYSEGTGTAWIGERAIAIATGDVVCYPPRLAHHERTTTPFRGIFMLVDDIADHRLAEQPIPDSADRTAGRICEAMLGRLHENGGRPDAVGQCLLEALLAFLHSRRAAKRRHPLVEELQRRLDQHVGDADYRIAAASADLPMSRDHLRRLFCDQVGATPAAYLQAARVRLAGSLLRMGRSVKQAALEAGYEDPYYFSRVFRQATGVPPSRWSMRG
jgi:AraC-like DNA-binding protein